MLYFSSLYDVFNYDILSIVWGVGNFEFDYHEIIGGHGLKILPNLLRGWYMFLW